MSKLTIDQELALFYRFGPEGIPEEDKEEERTARRLKKLIDEDDRQFDLHYHYYMRGLEDGTEDTPEEPEV